MSVSPVMGPSIPACGHWSELEPVPALPVVSPDRQGVTLLQFSSQIFTVLKKQLELCAGNLG